MKKIKSTKKLLSILLAVMLLGTLIGCGAGNSNGEETDVENTDKSDPEKTVSITFAGWGDLAEKQIYTKLIAAFMDDNPNIKVNYQHYAGGKDAYIVKMVSLIASDNLPEAFYLPTQDFMEWVNAGRLLDLTSYVDSSGTYADGLIWDQAMTMYRYNSATGAIGEDGGLYGLPKDLSVRVMVYNVDLFKANGVETPDPETPMTYSEYISRAQKLTYGSGTEKVYGTGNYVLDMAVWANSASYLSDDYTTVTVDTEEFAEALQWAADLNLKYGIAPNMTDTSTTDIQRFVNGKMAMMFIGPWQVATLWQSVDFDFDIAPIPVNEATGLSTTWLDSAALSVSASASQEKQEAAYKLIEYISMNEESQRMNYESGQAIPNIIEMAETEFVEMEGVPSNKQLFVNYLSDTDSYRLKDFYYTMNTEWYDYFDSNVSEVYSGKTTAADFVKNIQPHLQELLDASRE